MNWDSTTSGRAPEALHPSRMQPILWSCVIAWTVLTGLALWWLLRGNAGPSVWVIHDSDPMPSAMERYRAWFKADIGFQRIYPWVLLGPYLALLASYFPLERGRLKLNLTLNLLACAAFLAACQTMVLRTSLTGARVLIVKSLHSPDQQAGRHELSTNRIEVSLTGRGDFLQTQTSFSAGLEDHLLLPPTSKIVRRQDEISDPGLSNLLAQIHPGMKIPQPPPAPPAAGRWHILLDLLAYGAIVGLAHSVHYYRRFREREHRALFLESTLAHARLNALRAQLQPHFLFNSLNAVVTLLRRDPGLAEQTLTSLSELLRLVLNQSDRQETTLREELQFVQRYLEIQQTRFGDKLRVENKVEMQALDCLVPALLLQPLVENAILHGIEPAEHDCLVRLAAYRLDNRLLLAVEDDGVGLATVADDLSRVNHASPQKDAVTSPPAVLSSPTRDLSRRGNGIGLANLRARLQMLYGFDYTLELVSRQPGGVTARIEIPWHTAAIAEGLNRT
jgi:hypothetical protein